MDEETLERPHKWDIGFIRKFMLVFGLESSLFDLISFAVLIGVFKANADTFRTGWFMESAVTEILILLVIRTRRPLMKSKLSTILLISSLLVLVVTIVIPFIPIASSIGFVPLPAHLVLGQLTIAVLYAVVGELSKKVLLKTIQP